MTTPTPLQEDLNPDSVGLTVYEVARKSQDLLNRVSTGTAPSTRHREPVLLKIPENDTQRLFRGAKGTYHKFLKSYQISNELLNESPIVNDNLITNAAGIDLGEEKVTSIIKTLLTEHVDITEGGESWKPNDTRNPDYLSVIPAAIAGNGTDIPDKPYIPSEPTQSEFVIDTLIEMERELPTIHEAGAAWYMNRRTRAELRKIRNIQGDLLLTVDVENRDRIFGYPVVMVDDLAKIPSSAYRDPEKSVWLLFGNMEAAVKVNDLENTPPTIWNSYSDGHQIAKYETKYGVYLLDHTSLIAAAALPTQYPAPEPDPEPDPVNMSAPKKKKPASKKKA